MGLRRYRNLADDIDRADPEMVLDLRRDELMEEKGDKFLFELFLSDREYNENGKIKAYLDHDAITENEQKVARKNAYL